MLIAVCPLSWALGTIMYRPVAADVIISRIRTGMPTWRLFCVCGDSSFYDDLGKRSHAPTVLIVCVELNEMRWLINAYQ